MSDLIDRQKAIEALDFKIVHMMVFSNDEKNGTNPTNPTNPFAQYNKGLEDGIKAIRDLPSAEPERIAKVKVRYCVGYCECGQAVNTYSTYCHKCGAKLDWSENE